MEGFAYLAVVLDLYSRRVVGWSLQSRQRTVVVLQALHMAVWRRKPKNRVLIHSDQGSQFTLPWQFPRRLMECSRLLAQVKADQSILVYNPICKHVRNGMLSPVEFERQQALMAQGV